jgi:heat shock protein HtpX
MNLAPSRILRWQGAVKLNKYQQVELNDMVNQLASRAGLSNPPELYMVKNKVPNAFALGTKEKPVIGISIGLVSLLNQRELQGVLAHEISHIKNNDLFVKGLALSFGNLTNTLSTIGKFLLLLALPLYLMGIVSIPLFALILLLFSPVLNILLQLGLSRSMEFLADYDAGTITGDPMGLGLALLKLESLSKPWWRTLNHMTYKSSNWLSSHPETGKRIERLHEMAEQFPNYDPQSILNRRIPSLINGESPYSMS